MRKDFIKILTERPRAKGDKTYRNIRRSGRRSGKIGGKEYVYHAEEDGKSGEGMRRPFIEDGHPKELTDLISPLYRLLQSRVGKPWKKVHSEICSGLKGRSTQQQHLLDHLDHAVETKLKLGQNRELLESNGRPFMVYGYGMRRSFYVDPRDGILKAVTDKQRAKGWRDTAKNIMEMENELKTRDGDLFRRIEGIWYAITPIQESVRLYEGSDTFVLVNSEKKRQLSGEELKLRGLENVSDV